MADDMEFTGRFWKSKWGAPTVNDLILLKLIIWAIPFGANLSANVSLMEFSLSYLNDLSSSDCDR